MLDKITAIAQESGDPHRHTKLFPLLFAEPEIFCHAMSQIPFKGQAEIERMLVENIPKDVFMALEDAYRDGDRRGRQEGAKFSAGHRRSAGGQAKHFALNEAFFVALEAHGGSPTPLCGNRVVVGRLGKCNISRLNVPDHKWADLRRGKTRRQLAKINTAVARRYVQGDMFALGDEPISESSVFILGVMDGQDENGMAQLTSVLVALPAPDLRSWLYKEPLAKVLALYDVPAPVVQPDNVKPVLKSTRIKKTGNDQGN
ncbi:hypothetical protein [Roseateles sp.]|uniref:hypothetical protein n=1 Tax=Roseateles sp. TaxID=1971397 RepID=UPI0031D246E9